MSVVQTNLVVTYPCRGYPIASCELLLNIQQAILLVRESGEHDLLAQFHQPTDRTELLERELEALRDEHDDP